MDDENSPVEAYRTVPDLFSVWREMATRHDLELPGDECLFWASDFPHEGIVDMAKAVNEFLDRNDIPEPAKRKISYDNPRAMKREFKSFQPFKTLKLS